MDPLLQITRRHFLSRGSLGLGAVALSSLLPGCKPSGPQDLTATIQGMLGQTHRAPRAKRVIYLFQSGGPSQLELFDHKALLQKRWGEQLPPSVAKGQRVTEFTASQPKPMVGSYAGFQQHGQSGAWVSDLLPYTAKIADELCIIRSMYTDAINHDPALTFFQTGSQQSGRPSMGSWLSYGLGSDNSNLPAFCVLLSKGSGRAMAAQPLLARLWGSGFLSSQHQGVQFRSGKDPVLFINNPEGINLSSRRMMLNHLQQLNKRYGHKDGNPEIHARMVQYEMAYRMQSSVPEVTDLSDEPEHIFDLYGPEARIPGTYSANCLLARRLAERDVKFIQLYHQGWDQHNSLPDHLTKQCKDIDQPSAALVMDLKERGLLEDTLVIWGGEFGRTNYCQGKLTREDFGRDHHPYCFSMWMAGAGIKRGLQYGATDELGYNIVENPVHVHDFQATMLHLLGIDHERLTFKHQGRRYRLTDVHGKVVTDILT
ncbi:MAG: DUF1501 domain-containing protein [Saprospiraceae bacterium]|nr:DUF1501 domain-containing protein [Saprospiraceae bacterium]